MPKVLVGVIANDSARYSLFTACVMKLAYNMGRSGYEIAPEMLIGGDWCGARNNLARACLDGDYTHLWFMDDDHAFHEGMLDQLLSHDVPIVNPVCCTRIAPFPLVTYAGKGGAENQYLPLSLNDQQGVGLVELEAAGCAGMLIRRDVLEKTSIQYSGIQGDEMTKDRWFEYTDRSEDIVFCEKAKAAGFQLYADLSCRLGHITTAVVYPEIQDEKWMTLLNIGGLNIFVDSAENMDLDEQPDDQDVAEEPSLPLEPERSAAKNPCLICGKESIWTDATGASACEDHPGDHEAWKTYYERFEIWYVPEEGRWYARGLSIAGEVLATPLTGRPWTHEPPLVTEIETSFPGVPIFHVSDEMQDSRAGGTMGLGKLGPPRRMWTRFPE